MDINEIQNQSTSFIKEMLKFEGRRGRKSYAMFTLGVIGTILAIIVAGTILSVVSAGLGALFMIVALIPTAVIGWAATAQRIRDFGHSGCWAFVLLIPYVGFAFSIALFFIPGNPGANRYGEQP